MGVVPPELPSFDKLPPATVAQIQRLWPTPRAYSHTPGVSAPGLTPLDIQVREMYRDDPKHARYWPTPTVNNAKDKGTSPTEYARNTPDLSAAAQGSLEEALSNDPPKRLSAAWVSQLMGFSPDWTLLDPEKSSALGKRPARSSSSKTAPSASARSETPSSRRRRT